ncbi:hypothetical protein BH09VER1_BH09VER1_12470 [soil metagenome]
MTNESSRFAAFGVAVLFLAGCAVTPLPPVPPTHPASPQAAEAPFSHTDSLGSDEATSRTNRLLETANADNDNTAPDSMSSMPGMNH